MAAIVAMMTKVVLGVLATRVVPGVLTEESLLDRYVNKDSFLLFSISFFSV